jgi:hypothetical protein
LWRWRCQTRACPGALYISNENTIQSVVEHNHAKVWERLEEMK